MEQGKSEDDKKEGNKNGKKDGRFLKLIGLSPCTICFAMQDVD